MVERRMLRTMVAGATLLAVHAAYADRAGAHSFNVGLVVALGDSPVGDARQVRDGFLLATRERDSHPGEESDGHLGGLDVYVHLVALDDSSLSGVRALLQREHIDVLAVIGPSDAAERLRTLVADAPTVVLGPGRLPSPLPPAFARAFETAFGYAPGGQAAEGYNAARRIDAAVRPLGGVGDLAALRRAFDESRNGLDW